MKVYIVLSKGDWGGEVFVNAAFSDRQKAEAYMIKNAVEEMDHFDTPNEARRCYYNDGKLIQIYDDSEYYCDWWIEEKELDEEENYNG